MKRLARHVLILQAVVLLTSPCRAVQGAEKVPPYANRTVPLECQIEGSEDENFRYLAAQCWLPPSEKIRGILCVILHPDGSNGRTLAESEPWEKLAAAHDCALIGVSIVEPADPTKHWFSASLGSGRALLQAIDRFAQASGRPGLTNAPLALAGVCAAGQFAYEFAAFSPSRTSCFVTIGGAKHDLALAGDAARVQALLVVTPDRGTAAAANLEGLNFWGHQLGAPWSPIEGRIASYDAGQCQTKVLSFLETYLSASPSKEFPVAGSSKAEGILSTVKSSQANAGIPISTLSFLGKPLPILAHSGAPGDVRVTEEGDAPKTSFRVKAGEELKSDGISVPSPFATKVETEKVSESEWQIDLSVDFSSMPSGGFHVELPVRFSRNGMPILGGVQVPLSGSIERDIYASPRVLRLSSEGIPANGSVRLKSRSGKPITGLEVEAINPPGIAVHFEDQGTMEPRIILDGSGEPDGAAAQIAGYILVRAKSKDTQRVKIPFYGSTL